MVYRTFLFNQNNCNLTSQVELFYHILSNRADPAQFMNSLHVGGLLRHAGARLANTHTKDTSRLILWTDCTLRTTARNRHVFIVNHCWNQRQMRSVSSYCKPSAFHQVGGRIHPLVQNHDLVKSKEQKHLRNPLWYQGCMALNRSVKPKWVYARKGVTQC